MAMNPMDAQLGLAGNPTMLYLGGKSCYCGPILIVLLLLSTGKQLIVFVFYYYNLEKLKGIYRSRWSFTDRDTINNFGLPGLNNAKRIPLLLSFRWCYYFTSLYVGYCWLILGNQKIR